ncbi:MAG TPA: sugar ABC transporter substrate-binding protein [Spirochaetia bacterium]|nr:sugar ABC transporter substrate-binding protein [Spirochaetia bacterium]HRZ65673.1 sugar ABC transporter substrate-binding protein [Spirochaetia bacterium]
MKRVLILLLALCAATAAFAQGGAKTPVELRFTVWTGNEAHLQMLNGIAAKYTAAHPGVTVKFDTIPYDDYPQKLVLQLAGSNPPDAGWISEANAPAFVAAGNLADLTAAAAPYDLKDFSASATELWRKGSAIYGLPFSTSPLVVIYNKKLLAAAGAKTPSELEAKGQWTWEAFADLARTVKAKTGVYGFQTMDGSGYSDNLWATLVPMIRAYGGEVWNGKGVSTLDRPEAVKAVTLLHAMIYKDKSVVPPGEQADFFAGNAAMTVSQISRVSKLVGADFQWGLAKLPKGPAGDAQVIGQAAIVAFKASKNAALAADFAAFMTSKENVAVMTRFFPPARVSVLESESFTKGNPNIPPEAMASVVGAALKVGKILPNHPNFSEIDLAARACFDRLWRPDADVKSVMAAAARAVTPLLK